MAKFYTVKSRLKQGGDEVDITDFDLKASPGELGMTLDCQLAAFSPTVTDDPVTFEIGIKKGATTDYAMMLKDGRIKTRNDATRYPGDQTKLNIIDSVSNKWKLTPRIPLTLYDPSQIDIVTDATQGRQDIVDSNGNPILPIYTPVTGFDLNYLLNFVYQTKLGFASVVTNIENYPIQRADFGLQSPYHMAAGRIGLFEPKFSNDGLSRIFIIDAQATLPDGFPSAVRTCGPGTYAELIVEEDELPEINAVLLSYNARAITGTETESTEVEITETGTVGTADFQRSIVTHFFKDFHDDAANPSRVTRRVEWKTETRVSAFVDDFTREVSIETETGNFDYEYQLKTGWTRQVQVRMPLPGLESKMRLVQTETCRIVYVGTATPNELLKVAEITDVVGGVLVEGDDIDPDNPATRTALYEANARNISIPDDATVESDRPISSTVSRWSEVGSDQIQVQDNRINHLTGKPVVNRPTPHTGTLRVRLSRGLTKRTMLLRDLDNEDDNGTLPPASIDAGDVPFETARERAELILSRHGQQPQRVTIDFGGALDLSLRRGSLRIVQNRDSSAVYLVYITGYQITGKNLGDYRSAAVSMTAEGVVLQTL